MSDIVIRVENLSKRYVIKHAARGARGSSGDGLRHALQDAVSAPFQKLLRPRRSSLNTQHSTAQNASSEDFWALKDVSFEVKRGEVLGIIGRNGAGKSTLLKILSRITEPTKGRIGLKGRVASLLEVGTGFHPELTGRENIYLNGAILGMSREEVRQKFDEIVAFAGIEKFIDTPVKRYSSGMYVRLAFAVAAHLEPEILIIDEVLAVGDAEFQRRCLGKMQEVSRAGRTVLFVSHQMGTVAELCSRALLLSQGETAATGSPQSVIESYLDGSKVGRNIGFARSSHSPAKEMVILEARAVDETNQPCDRFTHKEDIIISVACETTTWTSGVELRLILRDARGRTVFTSDTSLLDVASHPAGHHGFKARAVIPRNFLRPQKFAVTLAIFIPDVLVIDLVEDAFSITVIDGGSKWSKSEGMDYGCVFANCAWSVDMLVARPD